MTSCTRGRLLTMPWPRILASLPVHPAFVAPQGVVNRDIKLENTLLDSSPRPLVKICDFGYSKVRSHLH